MDQAAGFYHPAWHDWLSHPDLDEYWYRLRLDGLFQSLDIPVLHTSGWFDDCLIPSTFNYEHMVSESRAPAGQFLLIGPWDHHGTRIPVRSLYGEDFGDAAVVSVLEIQRDFFDHYLKGKPALRLPKVRVFELGTNRWRTDESWPPPGVRSREFYLASGGSANTMDGDGLLVARPRKAEGADTYVYDPDDATPAWPGKKDWAPQALTLDQRWVQVRPDVLVYTSGPLAAPMEIAGTPTVVFHASSDAPDTDFYLTLSHVYPDGRAIRIAWNAIRARYRESRAHPTLMTPGKVYEFTLDLSPICCRMEKGHRVRLDIRSANFPLTERNANSGLPIGDDTVLHVARQTIYHGAGYPSRLMLPVRP
jgi:hypothetical protein